VKYKAFDDLLDGIFCAYLAYHFWQTGEEGCWVVETPRPVPSPCRSVS